MAKRKCLNCDNLIELKIKRDILRKRFCSRKCLGQFTWKSKSEEEKVKHLNKMIPLASTTESNSKKGHKGINHPLYKADRSQIKSKRPRYENSQWKISILKRDDYTCQRCFTRGGKLQVDHILPYHAYPNERWNIDNGRTLCVECHKKTKTYGRRIKDACKESCAS